MLRLIFWVILVTVVSSIHTSDELLINPQAALFNDVKRVHHNKTSRHVTIQLAMNRSCTEPTFMVRLSGTSLRILDLVHSNTTSPNTSTYHYPPINDRGMYFLEVLTLYCEKFDPDAFADLCLISPQEGKNVLTLPYSFEVKEVEHNLHPRPRWVLTHNATPALLPTRYQKKCGNTFCVSHEPDIAQHNQYEWTDKPLYQHLVQTTFEWGLSHLKTRTGNESITICMVGASHAGNIRASGNNLNISHVNFWWFGSRYPQLFDVTVLTNCTYTVVGYGQWPLSSWMGQQPYNATRYEFEIRKVLASIVAAELHTRVFMRSMNLNGLGYTETQCPPTDHRHPPVVMMYNDILSRLCKEYNVPYIDMHHLQAPLWDIALDWNHPKGRVFTAEAEYVLHYVLTYSQKHHLVPKLDPSFGTQTSFEWVVVPVQFNDSEVAYYAHGGVLRALPSHSTLSHLGFVANRSTIRVLDARRKGEYLFGPAMPDI